MEPNPFLFEKNKQYRRLTMAINNLNAMAAINPNIQHVFKFRVGELDPEIVNGQYVYTFYIEITIDGLVWKTISIHSGLDKNQTYIDIMKDLADRLNVPDI